LPAAAAAAAAAADPQEQTCAKQAHTLDPHYTHRQTALPRAGASA
jgi:hypothetical protein